MKQTLVLIVAFFTLTLGTGTPAVAQCPSPSIMQRSVMPQLKQNLAVVPQDQQTLDVAFHDASLTLALDLARNGCLKADGKLVRTLVDIYERSESDNRRILSALILGELDHRGGLMDLYRLSDDEESETVRRITLAVLASNQLFTVR